MPIVLPQPGLSKGAGSSEEIMIGTGTSQPGGVEAFFEYNGLVLNDRSVLDTFLILSIDGLADADVRDQRQVNPNYHGETAFNAWYGGRTLALTGRIRAHEIKKLRDMQESLKMVFGGLQELPLRIISNFTNHDVEISCRKSAPLTMVETQQNRMFTRDFLVTLRASDPRFRSVNQSVLQGLNTGTAFDAVTAINEGNHRAQPIITIQGPITDATLFNLNTEETLTLEGTIPNTQLVTINILKRTIRDQNNNNLFNMLDVSSDWPEITPGTNTIELTGTGITALTSWGLSFQHTWL
jgi:hypothetical protein